MRSGLGVSHYSLSCLPGSHSDLLFPSPGPLPFSWVRIVLTPPSSMFGTPLFLSSPSSSPPPASRICLLHLLSLICLSWLFLYLCHFLLCCLHLFLTFFFQLFCLPPSCRELLKRLKPAPAFFSQVWLVSQPCWQQRAGNISGPHFAAALIPTP